MKPGGGGGGGGGEGEGGGHTEFNRPHQVEPGYWRVNCRIPT